MNHSIVPFVRSKQFEVTLGMAFTVKADSIEQAKEKISNILDKLDEFETDDCQCSCCDFSSIEDVTRL